MISLFSRGSLAVLESLSFTSTLYAFDFDGTLAKIVRNPADAYMSATTEDLMRRLCQTVPVAIVSGRSVKDLKGRIHCHPRFLIGNHGLEGLTGAESRLAEAQKTCKVWREGIEKLTFDPGIELEDKGFSLALHFRRCRNKTRARQQIQTAVAQLRPIPRTITGKSVLNLLPAGAPHKGAAVLDLLKRSGLKHVFYIGDDDTDEDVFTLPYDKGQIMSVRIGRNRTSKAAYYIDRQFEINRLLRLILAHHGAGPAVERGIQA